MRYRHICLVAAISAAALSLGFISDAKAAVLVHIIQNDPTATDASMVPSSTLPSADFVSPDINFNVGNSDGQSLNAFLNNPAFINIKNGFDPTQNADNTFLEISAQTYLIAGVNSFVVGHDDGVLLTFASPIGVVVNAPGPTGFSNSPFNITVGQAGNYNFDLKYTECCSGPRKLSL